METRLQKKLKQSLPGGDRRGTPGADAGCHSMRTVSGRELNRRTPTGSPEINATADHQDPSSSSSSPKSLFSSVPSSPPSYLAFNSDYPSPISSHSENLIAVDVVQEAIANNPAPTTGQARARIKWTQEMNEFIWRTYLTVTKLETKIRGYLHPLYTQFVAKFPEINVSKQRIGDQRHAIIRNRLLPTSTLQFIKQDVAKNLKTVTDINALLTSVQPTNSNTSSRISWSDEINEAIITEYYRITSLETNRTAYRKLLHTSITQQFPQIAHVSEQRIADQRRVIINNKLISNERLDILREKVRDTLDLHTIDTSTSPQPEIGTSLTEQNQQNDHRHHHQYIENNSFEEIIQNTFQQTYEKFLNSNPVERPYIPKQKSSRKFAFIVSYLNRQVIPKYDSQENDFTKTHTLIYCAAYTAALCNGSKIKDPTEPVSSHVNQTSDIRPNWQKRLDIRIAKLRKAIGRISQYILGNRSLGLIRHVEKIKNKYKIHSNYEEPNNTDKQFMDTLKQKLNALSSRRRRYLNCTQRKQQNAQFTHNERQFYKNLTLNTTNVQNTKTPPSTSPTQQELQEFWSNVWSKPLFHNEQAPWIETEKQKVSEVPEMIFEDISGERFLTVLNKAHNWKTPGTDHIHNFYYKKLTSLHASLLNHINDFLKFPQIVPTFLTQGITYMIPKDPNSTNPEKFRPITCLQTIYKIITSCISQAIYKHLTDNSILAEEQKGCRKQSQGCKEQITIDTIAMKHTTVAKRDMCTMYIDYQKAFDSVPHSWLGYVLEHYKIHPTLIEFLKTIMQHWVTKLKINKSLVTDPIPIRRGIFQGDALSPLWFCLALNPLSNLLNGNDGLKIESEHSGSRNITHLLYMDDIKLYSNSISSLHYLADITQMFSNDICMAFGIDKCKTFTYRKGQYIGREPYILTTG
ncbi:hypothetical protein O3G_MSEX004071 [Manduca sexta]|uniref:Reverse transcriptase domain-containing protein n=1 Tax=Manduca sexta TaxID=7130 RepID=A0A921YVK2_MANSE|nr:hypothetical protein O3G_MSEX004071 [Manduca sexta]